MTLTDTEKMALIDKGQCNRFLEFMNKGREKNSPGHQNFTAILQDIEKDPFTVFKSGLHSMSESLDVMLDQPMARLAANPVGIFEAGLALGYAMALSSPHPDFETMLTKLTEFTWNVRPIESAKRAQKP